MPLTNKQEHFARLIALEGLNQSEAYRQAYDTSNYLPSTVTEDASRLAANSNVLARIQELKASLQAEAVTNATSLVRELLTVGNVKVPAEHVRAADKVAALDKVAKILGLYKDNDEIRQRPVAITQITVILDHGDTARARVVEAATDGPEVVPGMEEELLAPQTEP